MRSSSMLGWTALALLLASGAAAQGVNCEQVRRYAQTGRTAEQIAETMVVDVAAVKKCLEEAPDAAPLAGSAPAGGSGAASGGGKDE